MMAVWDHFLFEKKKKKRKERKHKEISYFAIHCVPYMGKVMIRSEAKNVLGM